MTPRFLVLLILLISLVGPSQAAQVAVPQASAETRAILDLIHDLQVSDRADSARAKLLKVPRPKLISLFREILKQGGVESQTVASAARQMGLKELVPDLNVQMKKHGNWQAALSIGELADNEQRQALAKDWLAHLTAYESPAQIAILETVANWEIPFTDQQFAAALASPSFEVRRTTVRMNLLTRKKLTPAQLTERFRQSFAAEPFEVRLDAMVAYQALEPKERGPASQAVDKGFRQRCINEKNLEVKTECQKIAKAEAK